VNIDPSTLTPSERLRGSIALIREQIAAAKAASGMIGKIDVQVLIAVPTDRGMGVIAALPADALFADIEAVTTPVDFTVFTVPEVAEEEPLASE
jgi:hypothetical protein